MHYMLAFNETTAELARREDPKTATEYWGAWSAYIRAIHEAGIVVSGHGLQPPHTGTTVRVEGGKRFVQDGPLPDAKEHLGGYFIIDVPDLDAALSWAARCRVLLWDRRNCGNAVVYRLPDDGDTKLRAVCPVCNTVHYENPLNVVGTVPTTPAASDNHNRAQRPSAPVPKASASRSRSTTP